MSRSIRRIFIDIGGYFLIFLGVATGWLPGPGGIPLILGGLALLSLHNEWARRLRIWLVRHGADFILKLFPRSHKIQLIYDVVAAIILVAIAWLVWNKAAYWQIGIAAGLFLCMIAIIGMNREQIIELRRRHGGIDNDPATPQ